MRLDSKQLIAGAEFPGKVDGESTTLRIAEILVQPTLFNREETIYIVADDYGRTHRWPIGTLEKAVRKPKRDYGY